MKKIEDDWAWTEISFAKWRAAVNRRLKKIYVITINDAGIDDEFLMSHWKMKQAHTSLSSGLGTNTTSIQNQRVGL